MRHFVALLAALTLAVLTVVSITPPVDAGALDGMEAGDCLEVEDITVKVVDLFQSCDEESCWWTLRTDEVTCAPDFSVGWSEAAWGEFECVLVNYHGHGCYSGG